MSEIIWGRYSLLVYTGIFCVVTFLLLSSYPFIVIFFIPSFILFSVEKGDLIKGKKTADPRLASYWVRVSHNSFQFK